MSSICLVSDSKSQRHMKSLAENLFSSALFQKSKAYATTKCTRWYILSARYGLIEPNQLIEPYGMMFDDLPGEQKFKWGQQVLASILQQRIVTYDVIVLLAGASYQAYLLPVLQARRYTVETPLKGLSAVDQLAWLERATKS